MSRLKIVSIITASVLAVSGLTFFAVSPAGAEKGSVSLNEYKPVDLKSDEVIVTASSTAAATASKYDSYKSIIEAKVSTFYLSKADAADLIQLYPEISVEESKTFTTETTQSPTPNWGLDNIDSVNNVRFNNAYSYDTTGRGVKIYVIDSGVRTTHADFTGRVAAGYNAVGDGASYEDCEGHGTHVAGIAAGTRYGVAKEATIVPVRALKCDGSGTSAEILTAVNWISSTHTGGPAVVNLSISGDFSAAVNNAVQSLIDKGFIVISAAGNNKLDSCQMSPASALNAITVGALDNGLASNKWADYSNYGLCVDINAPGSNIESDWITGDYAAAIGSGTSMAAPMVAGAVARLLQANPSYRQSDVNSWLIVNSSKAAIEGLPANTTVNSLYVPSVMLSPTATPSPTGSPTPSTTPTATPTPSFKPVKPVVGVTLKSRTFYISAKATNDLRRENSFTIKIYRNNKLLKTKTFNLSANTGMVYYTYSNLSKGSYVIKVTSKNNYGSSPLFTSKAFKQG